MTYKIEAEYNDKGTWIMSDNSETLGNFAGVEFESIAEAKTALVELDETKSSYHDNPDKIRFEIVEA